MSFGISIGGRKKDRELKEKGNFDLRDDRSQTVNKMERDHVMTRMIREGKGSDPGIKREAESIQREHENNRKSNNRERDQRELHDMRVKYKLTPEQMRRNAS